MKTSGWLQTIIMVLTVVAACVSGALWIQAENQKLYTLVTANKSEQDIFNQAILTRLTSAGWTFRQQLKWVNDLRAQANHPVPSVEPLEFNFTGKGSRR